MKKPQTAFTRYMAAMNQEAEKRSAAETRAIRRATLGMMIFAGVIALVTIAGVVAKLERTLVPPVLDTNYK